MSEGNGGLGTAADLLGADDIVTQEVPVPAWGKTFAIRKMPSGDWFAYHAESGWFTSGGDLGKLEFEKLQVLLVWYTVCDSRGQRLFTDRADIEKLSEKSMEGIRTLYNASLELSKAGPFAEGAISDRVGESKAGRSKGASSRSRSRPAASH